EIGRKQVREGAHIVDVCLQDPDRDELTDITGFLNVLTRKIKAPIMLDSTDDTVIEESLKLTPGKSIINSVNLEDGETRFKRVAPLANRYGAALVVGCIDDDKEQAQAITRERKLEIAERSLSILTEKYGVRAEDIIFDPLVFPVGTGDKTYIGAGVETIEGIRLIKEALPQCKTILGISNVSFGLPPAGREVLNSVFLYHCVQAGLDMAIVNTERLQRYPSITDEERLLAEDLLWWRGDDPIAAFAAHFRDKAQMPTTSDRALLPLDERLARCIIDGSKEGLIDDLDEAVKDRSPMEVINGPLMDGMKEVGRLFNENRLIVAEVLQSAEAMKAAVTHLEPMMEASGGISKGKIILATVKGDVHDIGKNLVDIVLSNNGFEIVNLGIKVPPQDLVTAYKQHKPDVIGLSGLLVKSAQMMVQTAQDLTDAGIDCPILVGGAALSNRFTRLRIAPEYKGLVIYAKDAMDGLNLAHRVMDVDEREAFRADLAAEAEELRKRQQPTAKTQPAQERTGPSPTARQGLGIPNPPDLKLHTLMDYDLEKVFRYINPQMLYVRHLGYRKRFTEAVAEGEPKALELRDAVRKVEEAMLASADIQARAVFKFFPCQSQGRQLLIYAAPDGGRVLEQFTFGRQQEHDGLSLVDYVASVESGRMDYVAMFVTSAGPGAVTMANAYKDEGAFLASHIMQALALESAEAFAELLHQQIRKAW
ncbi:MAG: dihydropteroate synthase, partial [Chloroflexi bacterium]|nr:dihydropteroate synthase [Chloroflexota bacterium]